MAGRDLALRPVHPPAAYRGWWVPGALVLVLIALVLGGSASALVAAASHIENPLALLGDAYLRRIIQFTLWQATLSTALSLALALPIARALHRRPAFRGRQLLLYCFSLAFILPAIVAIFGIVAVHGRAGWINQLLEWAGLPPAWYLYGLPGILIAHVFFNMPLAARIFLQRLEAVPPESWQLATQLGFNSRDCFRLIEWPVLRASLATTGAMIFLLCATSFAVVLTLGGGPRATTLEVAIYQALRLDFDIPRAVALAVLQIVLTGALSLAALRFHHLPATTAGLRRTVRRPDSSRTTLPADIAALALAVLLVVLPLASVVIRGLQGPVLASLADRALWHATATSLVVAGSAGAGATLAGYLLLLTSRHLALRLGRDKAALALEFAGSFILVVPPFTLAAGLFLLLRSHAAAFDIALPAVALTNGLAALPFVLRILSQPMREVAQRYDRLAASLGLAGWNRLRLLELPLLRRPLGLALALSIALSFGDLGVIALFGSGDSPTLPMLLYQRLGAYQFRGAAVTALFLALLSLGLFAVIERGIGGRAEGKKT
jgi:thiamine transport system permease protein